ncbi:MAG: rhomboid family intramembrane serine protease [Limisphaerales bacterium]
MYPCPDCHEVLAEARDENGTTYRCLSCSGEAVTVFRLRQLVGTDMTQSMSRLATATKVRSKRRCPVCEKRMLEIPLAAGEENFEIEHCPNCAMFWFDSGDLERLPEEAKGVFNPAIDAAEAARERAATAAVDNMRLDAQEGEPGEGWKYVVGFLGFPVEYDHPSQSQPLATWGVAAACVLMFILSLTVGLIDTFAFVPNEAYRWGGITAVTSFFLHGSWMHLFGNMYFLCIFGDNVEERLGWRRFLLMLFAGAVMGALLHGLFDREPWRPTIGASDGISAVIVYYALQFPRERLAFMFWWRFWDMHWISIPASWCLVMWVAEQALLTHFQLSGIGDISALAHVGGALTGVGFWWCHEKHLPGQETQPTRVQTALR